jgi:uncharacterized membrane protein
MRIIAKTTTYGIMHIVVAFFVALAVSRDLHIALGISLTEPFIQTFCFSIHEHIWEKIRPNEKPTPNVCCAESDLVSRAIGFFFPKKN